MPYWVTPLYAGGIYHLYNRGNNRGRLFFEAENYRFFLRQLEKYFLPAQIELLAYCLMPNHYHLLVLLHDANLSAVMQRFSLSYSKAMARRFQRTGSLFEGPFQSRHVAKYEYLLHLSRYIHLNPVVAGLVSRPEDWEFSSYREYLGLRAGGPARPEVVLGVLEARGYQEFVESALADESEIADLRID